MPGLLLLCKEACREGLWPDAVARKCFVVASLKTPLRVHPESLAHPNLAVWCLQLPELIVAALGSSPLPWMEKLAIVMPGD